MEKILKISGTSTTPYVLFNGEAGELYLSGNSTPKNSLEFYQPILEWLNEYGKDPQEEIVIHIQLDICDTSSYKSIMSIFMSLDKICYDDDDKQVFIKWYYKENDENMMEEGEE